MSDLCNCPCSAVSETNCVRHPHLPEVNITCQGCHRLSGRLSFQVSSAAYKVRVTKESPVLALPFAFWDKQTADVLSDVHLQAAKAERHITVI